MKKILALLTLALILTGCGQAKGNTQISTTKTTCIIDAPYLQYISGEQVYVAEGDKVTLMKTKGVLELQTEDQVDTLIESIQDALILINNIPGMKASADRIDSTSLYDIMEIDLTVADFETLQELGVFPENDISGADYISLKKSVKEVESQGFVCTVE